MNINKQRMDVIKLLAEFLFPFFFKYVYEQRSYEWEHLTDGGWQEIGFEMFHDDI